MNEITLVQELGELSTAYAEFQALLEQLRSLSSFENMCVPKIGNPTLFSKCEVDSWFVFIGSHPNDPDSWARNCPLQGQAERAEAVET